MKKKIGIDKDLRFDGSTMASWQCYWDIIKNEVISLFKEF